MYSLISGFWRMLFAKVQYQVLILGLDDSGKTTLLEQLRHLYSGTPAPRDLRFPPTVGLNLGNLEVDRARLMFWDLGGQQGLRVLWDKYFSDAHALIYVMDSSDGVRIGESVSELDKLMADKELSEVPLLILCNKQDVEGALRGSVIEREVRDTGGVRPGRDVKVQEISALNGDGIQQGLDWLLHILPRSKRTKTLAERMI